MGNGTQTHASADGNHPSVTVVLFRDEELIGDARSRSRKEIGASLMRAALALDTGIEARRWTIGRHASGQPVVADGPADAPDTQVSLSHSGSLFAAAASSCNALGVDIETVRKRRFRKIAEYSNWPSSIWSGEQELTASRFFQLWTLWEATIKATAGRVDEKTHTLFSDLAGQTSAGHPSLSGHNEWRTRSWQGTDEFWISVVAEIDKPPRIRLYELESSEPGERDPDFQNILDDPEFLNSRRTTAGIRAQR